jgi:hypothetical protein
MSYLGSPAELEFIFLRTYANRCNNALCRHLRQRASMANKSSDQAAGSGASADVPAAIDAPEPDELPNLARQAV